MLEKKSEMLDEAKVKTSNVSILFQLTSIQAMDATSANLLEALSKVPTKSKLCKACQAEANILHAEIDFLKTLLKKNEIPIPEGSYGQMQDGFSDPLLEAFKVINDLKSHVAKLQEKISE